VALNGYEIAGRAAKASKLVDALIDAGVTSGVARMLDDVDWATVARLAKCNPPHSQDTKDAVFARLDQIERATREAK
jgi:glycine cleavage system aminomethyltransferase T